MFGNNILRLSLTNNYYEVNYTFEPDDSIKRCKYGSMMILEVEDLQNLANCKDDSLHAGFWEKFIWNMRFIMLVHLRIWLKEDISDIIFHNWNPVFWSVILWDSRGKTEDMKIWAYKRFHHFDFSNYTGVRE